MVPAQSPSQSKNNQSTGALLTVLIHRSLNAHPEGGELGTQSESHGQAVLRVPSFLLPRQGNHDPCRLQGANSRLKLFNEG